MRTVPLEDNIQIFSKILILGVKSTLTASGNNQLFVRYLSSSRNGGEEIIPPPEAHLTGGFSSGVEMVIVMTLSCRVAHMLAA